jgi:cold shock CspA family protein
MKLNGVITHFNERGFGFLFCSELGRRVFFHATAFNRASDPVVGEPVAFELAPAKVAGKPDMAVNVAPIGDMAGAAGLSGVTR